MRLNTIFIVFIWTIQSLIISSYASIELFDNAGQFYSSTQKKQGDMEMIHLQLLKNAKESIYIEIYEMRNKEFQEEIFRALERGVLVNMVIEPDPVGNACDALSAKEKNDNPRCEISQNFIDRFDDVVKKMSKKYANKKVGLSKIRYYNKNLCNSNGTKNCFMHGKMIIVDESRVLLSTGNFNDTSFCDISIKNKNECRRDFSILIQDDKKVAKFKEIFFLDFEHGTPCDIGPEKLKSGRPLSLTEERCQLQISKEKNVPIEKISKEILQHLDKNMGMAKGEIFEITVSPYSEKRMIDLIDSAKNKIQVQAQYIKVESWLKALLRALERGVKVEINLASLCHFYGKNGPSISYKDYHHEEGLFGKFINPLRFFDKNAAHIKFFIQGVPYPHKGIGGYLHAKVFIIDEKVAWIGSTNGSEMSNSYNREYGVIFNNNKIVKELSHFVSQDFERSWSVEEHIPDPYGMDHHRKINSGACLVHPGSK